MCGLLWKHIFVLIVLVYQVRGLDPDDDDVFFPNSGDFEHDDSAAADLNEHHPEKLVARSGPDDVVEPRIVPGRHTSNSGLQIRRRPLRCFFSPDPGECTPKYPRFYYNYVTDICLMFLWSGCGGNANRFLTQTECMNVCKPA